jgi:hypothetical protein
MGRKKVAEDEVLKHEIKTRVNSKKFQELEAILKKTAHKDMSGLVRDILHNRSVKLHIYDRSLDMVMEELSSLRAELRAIGININQVIRHFNSYPDLRKKEFYAKVAFRQYVGIETKVDQLLAIITKLSKKWLSE